MSSQGCSSNTASPVDVLLDSLSHHHRREVIHFFERHTATPTATLDELVTYLQRRQTAATDERLEISLRHVHLPKLDDSGWLEYDSRTDEIHYRGHDHAASRLAEVRAIFSA